MTFFTIGNVLKKHFIMVTSFLNNSARFPICNSILISYNSKVFKYYVFQNFKPNFLDLSLNLMQLVFDSIEMNLNEVLNNLQCTFYLRIDSTTLNVMLISFNTTVSTRTEQPNPLSLPITLSDTIFLNCRRVLYQFEIGISIIFTPSLKM